MKTKVTMKPFLKWVGGKRWFVTNCNKYFPNKFNNYIEPFLGSGAVFFSLNAKSSILSDMNQNLIDTYRGVKEQPDKVWKHLLVHRRNHSKDYYYRIRTSKTRTISAHAAKFIYLNRTCFNGLYRVNLKGEFNVPKGTKDSVIFIDDDLLAISNYLRQSKIYTQDFEITLNKAGQKDFVYIDPPYTVRHNSNNFIKYNENIFSWEDQERLARTLTRAVKRGAYILISNANHQCINELYSAPCWKKIVVERHGILASVVSNRKKTTELVISNYFM